MAIDKTDAAKEIDNAENVPGLVAHVKRKFTSAEDGKNEDEFKNQNYQFSIKVSGDTFQIKAKHKTGSCTLTLNEKNKLTPSGC